jgi:hypothetical protein
MMPPSSGQKFRPNVEELEQILVKLAGKAALNEPAQVRRSEKPVAPERDVL